MLDLIVNPMARRGRGLADLKKAKDVFNKLGVEYVQHVSEYHKHSVILAYNLVTEGADTIVACGGDGTISEILNGYMSAKIEMEKLGKSCKTKLALLPCGTGNDFMRSAKLDLDIEKAAKVVAFGAPQPIDVIEIDGYYEITFACKGIDVDVVNMVNKGKRKTENSYLKNILKCLFKGINYDFEIKYDDNTLSFKGIFAAVLNGGKLASGMEFSPNAKIDDGLMDLVLVKKASFFKTLKTLVAVMKGKVLEREDVFIYQCKTAQIKNSQSQIDIDGELIDDVNFCAKVVPSALELIK